MIHFQHIEYLWLLAGLPLMILLFYSLLKWKKNAARKIGDPALVKELTAGYSPRKFAARFILFMLAFALCVAAVAGLVKPDGTQKINRKGTDIMIALDVSKSMLAEDVRPNRLERARQLISKVIESSPDDRIGLVVFAGRAYLQMPLTFDHAAARMYLAAVSPDDIPTQGTVISDALRMCAAAFDPKQKTFKSILLISDGEDHDDEAIKAAKELAEQGVMINTVGIGSATGAPIKDEETGQYKTDQQGQTVISKLNEKELNDIALAGSGIYQLFNGAENVARKVRTKLNSQGSETTLSDSSFSSFRQYYQYFLAAAFLLLLIDLFMPERRKLAVMVCFILSASVSQAQSTEIARGNQAFKENNLNEAEAFYRDALKKSDKSAMASFNLGNVLYRKEKPAEAAEAYDAAIANSQENTLKQKAYYNKGVALQKMDKLPECIVAYKNALLLNENDEDARQNLQRALKKQQEQKKQNDKNKDQNKQQDQKDQKKQDKNKKDEPKPQPARISKEDAEEKLKTLQQKENDLQDKLRKVKGTAPQTPEKDW